MLAIALEQAVTTFRSNSLTENLPRTYAGVFEGARFHQLPIVFNGAAITSAPGVINLAALILAIFTFSLFSLSKSEKLKEGATFDRVALEESAKRDHE